MLCRRPAFAKSSCRSSVHVRRSGIATVWIIAGVPAFLFMLVMLTDLGTIWQARAELETALESAALAGVQQWKVVPADTITPRNTAIAFGKANTVVGHTFTLDSNFSGSDPNGNAACNGQIVFGQIDLAQNFTAGNVPNAPNYFGVHVKKTVSIASLWTKFGGVTFGPYNVTAQTTAQLQVAAGGTPQLVLLNSFTCP
jgi:Flp pilus assembly protein TadG